MSPSSIDSRGSRHPAEHEWQTYRSLICKLYENSTLADVMRCMEREHGFQASPKMYKSRLAKWGLRKNIKQEEMSVLAKLYSRRLKEGRSTKMEFRGKPVSPHQMQRFLKQRGSPQDSGSESPPPTPEAMRCNSPDTQWQPADTPWDLSFDLAGMDPFGWTLIPEYSQAPEFLQPRAVSESTSLSGLCLSPSPYFGLTSSDFQDDTVTQLDLASSALLQIRQFSCETVACYRDNASTEHWNSENSHDPAFMLLRCSHGPISCDCLPYSLLSDRWPDKAKSREYFKLTGQKVFALTCVMQISHILTIERFIDALCLRRLRSPSAILLTLGSLVNLTLSYLDHEDPRLSTLHDYVKKLPNKIDWHDSFVEEILGACPDDPLIFLAPSSTSKHYSVPYPCRWEMPLFCADGNKAASICLPPSVQCGPLTPILLNSALENDELKKLDHLRKEELLHPSRATAWVLCKLLELQAVLESIIKLEGGDIFRDETPLEEESSPQCPWAIIKMDLLEDLAPVAYKLGTIADMESLVKSTLAERSRGW